MIDENCTEDCERMPTCLRCGLTKPPRGRSVPMAAGNAYCGWGCAGYDEEPTPGHLWPGELRRLREDAREAGGR